MKSGEWKLRAQEHRNKAQEFRAEADRLCSDAASEETAAFSCELNATQAEIQEKLANQ